MDNSGNLSFAINFVDSKIACLNMQLVNEKNAELEKELENYLNAKKKIYQGDKSIVEEIIKAEK